jgi:hypothetical protein
MLIWAAMAGRIAPA